MAFPGAGAQIYRNEVGEVIGWDYPSYDEPYEDFEDAFDPYDDDYETCFGCGELVELCDCDDVDAAREEREADERWANEQGRREIRGLK